MLVEAREVRVGDEIYNWLATQPAFRWCRVTNVELIPKPPGPPQEGQYAAVKIHTSSWATHKHEREAVLVRRT